MQPGAGIGAQPNDVARIGRNFRLVQGDVKHQVVAMLILMCRISAKSNLLTGP